MTHRTFKNFMTSKTSKENLFEANPAYEKAMIEIFNKAVKDELEASINYKIMAEQIQGPGINQIKTELEKHGEEEYKHFTEFIAYASDHSILNDITFEIDSDNVNPLKLPRDVQGIVAFSQDLEKKAYSDYKAAAQLATKNNDNETRMFFERLMADEMAHFDDISDLDSAGSIRTFGESRAQANVIIPFSEITMADKELFTEEMNEGTAGCKLDKGYEFYPKKGTRVVVLEYCSEKEDLVIVKDKRSGKEKRYTRKEFKDNFHLNGWGMYD